MNLGNKIGYLRKKKNLSQEELAEMIGVTRQTISKWELGDTTPDINQAKMLAKIFDVSLDELTNNDINNILVQKISNTERLAGITIGILKVMGIFLVVIFVIVIIAIALFIIFRINNRDNVVVGGYSVKCQLDGEIYLYDVDYNKNYQIINAGGDAWISNHIDIFRLDDANQVVAHIEDYFKDHNGLCSTEQVDK